MPVSVHPFLIISFTHNLLLLRPVFCVLGPRKCDLQRRQSSYSQDAALIFNYGERSKLNLSAKHVDGKHRRAIYARCFVASTFPAYSLLLVCTPHVYQPRTSQLQQNKQLLFPERCDSKPPVSPLKALEAQVLQRHVPACQTQH